MKRRIIAVLCMATLACMLVSGCSTGNQKEMESADASEEETDAEGAADSGLEEGDGEAAPEEEASPDRQQEAPAAELEDGVYTAEFDTDSSMFHVNEACEGKGTLTVENGGMTIHISLVSKSIVNLFPGLAQDAQQEGAELLEPSTDTVTYSDGMTEEVYGFDVPVPALDEEFDLALLGEKGKWYDHKVRVSNPERAD